MSIVYPITLPSGLAPSSMTVTPNDLVAVAQSPFTGRQQVQRWPGQWWILTMDYAVLTPAQLNLWAATMMRLKGAYGTFLFGDPSMATPQGAATGTPVVSAANVTLNTNADAPSGSFSLPFTSTSGVQVGQSVSGTGIDPGSIVTAVTSTTVTMNFATIADCPASTAITFSGISGDYLFSRGWTANVSGILKAGDYVQVGTGASTTLYRLTADAASDAYGYAALEVWPQVRQNPSPPADGATIITSNTVGQFRMDKSASWKITPPVYGSMSISAREVL